MKGMKMATELEGLKIKKRMKKATPEDLVRLKLLQDGEQLSAADLAEVKWREEDRKAAAKADFDKRKEKPELRYQDIEVTGTLDLPHDHPRITAMKQALMPFTQIEAHASRPDEFVLFTRGISITAGDVRKARKAMGI